jgi:hypothetical protein
LAATFAKGGGDIGGLRSAISSLATKRGISNWEVDPTTTQAIGRGLRSGGMQEESFVAFSKDLFGDDLSKQSELRQGYDENAPSAPS